jgi:hypothetical protein
MALSAGAAVGEGWPNRPLGFVTIPEPSRTIPEKPPCRWHGYACAPRYGYRIDWHVTPSPKPALPRPLTLGEARALLDAGRLEAAQAALKTLAGTTPQDPAVWALLARADRRLGRLDAAGESLRRALGIDPGHPGALAEQGFLHLASGRPAQALTTLAALSDSCGDCAEAVTLRSALTGAGYHEGVTGAKRIRLAP